MAKDIAGVEFKTGDYALKSGTDEKRLIIDMTDTTVRLNGEPEEVAWQPGADFVIIGNVSDFN